MGKKERGLWRAVGCQTRAGAASCNRTRTCPLGIRTATGSRRDCRQTAGQAQGLGVVLESAAHFTPGLFSIRPSAVNHENTSAAPGLPHAQAGAPRGPFVSGESGAVILLVHTGPWGGAAGLRIPFNHFWGASPGPHEEPWPVTEGGGEK